MLDMILTGEVTASSSRPAATRSKSAVPVCEEQAAALSPAPSPNKSGQSGEVGGGGVCCMTVDTRLTGVAAASSSAPAATRHTRASARSAGEAAAPQIAPSPDG